MTFFKLKIHQNSFSAGAKPRTLLGALTMLPRHLVGWRKGHPSHAILLRRVQLFNFGASRKVSCGSRT